MPMVQIGIMRMCMYHRRMGMVVHMGLAGRVAGRMFVLMVVVVDVGMAVIERLMHMFVVMALDQMEP
jgi:hypothetical protein